MEAGPVRFFTPAGQSLGPDRPGRNAVPKWRTRTQPTERRGQDRRWWGTRERSSCKSSSLFFPRRQGRSGQPGVGVAIISGERAGRPLQHSHVVGLLGKLRLFVCQFGLQMFLVREDAPLPLADCPVLTHPDLLCDLKAKGPL